MSLWVEYQGAIADAAARIDASGAHLFGTKQADGAGGVEPGRCHRAQCFGAWLGTLFHPRAWGWIVECHDDAEPPERSVIVRGHSRKPSQGDPTINPHHHR